MKFKDVLQMMVWEGVNPLLLGLKKRKVYRFNGTYAGINLGCGMDNPPNWLGVDGGVYVLLHKIPRPIIKLIYGLTKSSKAYSKEQYVAKIRGTKVTHHDLAFGLPFHDNSIPAVYSSHFFEHIEKRDAESLLAECFRVMRPGSMIRIVVPSLDKEVCAMREALEHYEAGNVVPVQKYVTSNAIGYNSAYSNHRWMYNFQEIQESLARAGFRNVVERPFREGDFPDVKTIETRGGLAVEAIKPD